MLVMVGNNMAILSLHRKMDNTRLSIVNLSFDSYLTQRIAFIAMGVFAYRFQVRMPPRGGKERGLCTCLLSQGAQKETYMRCVTLSSVPMNSTLLNTSTHPT